jgi:epoxide hydrolase-like predicted phosphatase
VIEAIVFDFDGTLVDYIDSDIKSLKHLHSVVEAKVSFDEFLKTAVDVIMEFHRLVEQRLIDPLLMHNFRLEKTFKAHEMQWEDSFLETYKDELFRTCVPFDGVVEVLDQLRERFKLGLITNAYDGVEQRKRIAFSGLHKYFDEILISGDIGVYKPDPKVFHTLLNRIGVVPENAIYIGDSIKHDVAGANSAGMKSVLFSKSSKILSSEAHFHAHGVEGLETLASELCELAWTRS